SAWSWWWTRFPSCSGYISHRRHASMTSLPSWRTGRKHRDRSAVVADSVQGAPVELPMTSQPRSGSFADRHLDPASRLGEILFGLIMVLTATLTAGLTAPEGPEGMRQMLFAALGCNIAWGIIDAVMYVMNCMTERAEKARLIEAVQSAPDDRAALAFI